MRIGRLQANQIPKGSFATIYMSITENVYEHVDSSSSRLSNNSKRRRKVILLYDVATTGLSRVGDMVKDMRIHLSPPKRLRVIGGRG